MKRKLHNRMRTALLPALALATLLGVSYRVSAEIPFPEGEMLLRHSEGPRATDFRLVKSLQILRVEQLTESRPPAPVNLIDLESGEITIIAPINQSVRTLPAAAFDPPKPVDPDAAWEPPPGIGANPGPPGTPAAPPAQAALPQVPATIPGALTGGIPPMPGFPDLPGMGGPVGELMAHEETREIQGYPCRRHTLLLDRSLELTLWLSGHPDLPPFHLLRWGEPPRFGPRDPMQDWPGIVRRSGKFPLLAELHEAQRPSFHAPPAGAAEGELHEAEEERRVLATWEVVSITPGKPDPAHFKIPEGYFRIER